MLSLSAVTGFFFAFRLALSFLFFQSNPRLGTTVNLSVSVVLLFAALIARAGDFHFSLRTLRSNPVIRWLILYLIATGASVLWTQAESPVIAAGYWFGMVMDVVTALLLLSGSEFDRTSDLILSGFVSGTLVVAAVAWMSPTLPDLRIGNTEFLHPNNLGLEFGLAFLIAQRLASEQLIYRIAAIILGLSALRSLSKTAIIALVITEAIYLVRTSRLSKAAKLRVAALAGVILVAFSGLFFAYVDIYANEGNSPETLTGRTAIWATSILMSFEHPWLGHGIYSFRALVPAFGTFEPWHAHNEFLQQFFELGLLGVVITAALYLALFRMARRDRCNRLSETAMLLVVFTLIRGLADTLVFGLSLPLWLFALLACNLSRSYTAAPEAA